MVVLEAPYSILLSNNKCIHYRLCFGQSIDFVLAGIDCFMPANGETSHIKTKHNLPIDTSLSLLKRQMVPAEGELTYFFFFF